MPRPERHANCVETLSQSASSGGRDSLFKAPEEDAGDEARMFGEWHAHRQVMLEVQAWSLGSKSKGG